MSQHPSPVTYCGNNVSRPAAVRPTAAQLGPDRISRSWTGGGGGGAGGLTQVPFGAVWSFISDLMSLPSPPQIVFEAVTSGQRGLLAIKDVVVQGHQCSKSFFFSFFF